MLDILPDRPIPIAGIKLATNGTDLLSSVIRRAPNLADHVYMVCSSIAWIELKLALHKHHKGYAQAELLSRTLVPFRIPWLTITDRDSQQSMRSKHRYMTDVLKHRGLLDLDGLGRTDSSYQTNKLKILSEVDWPIPSFQENDSDLQHVVANQLSQIEQSSRGNRYWHEVRCFRLDTC